MAEPVKSSKGAWRVWIAQHLGAAGTIVFAAALAAGYFLLFAPEMRRIRQANRTRALEQERQAKTAYLRDLGSLETNFRQLPPEDVEKILSMIPSEEDIPGILAALEASANVSDIAMSAVNFSKGEKTGAIAGVGGIEVMTIALSLEHGDYRRFKLFMEALEQNLRLFDVAGVTLNPTTAQYTLTIRAYVQSKSVVFYGWKIV